jgi:hypothetical protein
MVKLLLQYKADKKIENYDGFTADYYAKMGGNNMVIEQIK